MVVSTLYEGDQLLQPIAPMPLSNSHFRRQAIRALVVWFLIGFQAEIAWVGEFHRHSEEIVGMGGATRLERATGQPTDAHQSPRCVACQIKLERAAAPVIGQVPSAPAVVRTLVPVSNSLLFSLHHFAIESPRAPPAI
jgi:hypothetical protein